MIRCPLVTLINPALITQTGDSLGSGIPYLPLNLACLAAILQDVYEVNVIDVFGEQPFVIRREGDFLVQGIDYYDVIERINTSSIAVVIYYSTVVAYFWVKKLLTLLKEYFPAIPVLIVENSQAVVGCSLKYIAKEFLEFGADFIVLGECEHRVSHLINVLYTSDLSVIPTMDGLVYKDSAENIVYCEKRGDIPDLNQLPFPAWEYFPLQNYWKLGYAHGPMENKYLTIMTSRGCPFSCNFCVIPSMNNQRWRARTAENVVDEMEFMGERFGVNEFHWEDVNPTVSKKRIIEICQLIVQRNLKLKWKLVSGSKIETMNIETLTWMKNSGCNYISFSPESGSKRVLELMNKPFDHEYALNMVHSMNKLNIKTQACFVLGFPGETFSDLEATKNYAKQLTKAGIDEIALFIMTPLPGSRVFGQITGYSDYSELTFSPSWREDYKTLEQFRKHLYLLFLIWKIGLYPWRVFRQGLNLLTKRFENKAEMNIYRTIKLKFLVLKGRING